MKELCYFHDPMCSWCWGFRPTLEKLLDRLPDDLAVRYVVGGLAPDSNQPMPVEQQKAIKAHWTRIEAMLGTEFNHEFWVQCAPRRSTYPACRAVIAAGRQKAGEAMTIAIQRAYYLEARNPSDASTLLELAAELVLDVRSFRAAFESDEIEAELQRQIAFCRQYGVSGFPSLGLLIAETMTMIDIDYTDSAKMARAIAKLIDN